MTDPRVPLEYFMGASTQSLENFEMNRLSAAANIEKEIKLMQAEAQLLREAAGVARWLIDNREDLLRKVGSHLDSAKAAASVRSISDVA